MPVLYQVVNNIVVQTFPLQTGRSLLGSAPHCGIWLWDSSVAPVHAEIVMTDQHIWLHDGGTPTGTWLNGSRVTVPAVLVDKARIRIGNRELVFRHLTSPPFMTRQVAKQPPVAAVATSSPVPLDVPMTSAPKNGGWFFRCWWRIRWSSISIGWRIRRR